MLLLQRYEVMETFRRREGLHSDGPWECGVAEIEG